MKRFAVVAALVSWGMLTLAHAATASWAQQNTAAPAGELTWDLTAIWCTPPVAACVALGTSTDAGGSHLLAETRTGHTWTLQSIAAPFGANDPELTGTSCTSSSACIAVGTYLTNSSNRVAFAESWDGTSWTIQTVPTPGGATDTSLSDVSCTSSSACIAVGDWSNGTNTMTLAESWDGTNWSIQTTPNPGGATRASLGGVSCPSVTACIAAGSSSNGAGTVPLAESWDGTAWTIQTTPNPAGTNNHLNDVSCSSSAACTAVGNGFAERWDGTSWALQTTPSPGGGGLESVSCAAATSCAAVGFHYVDAIAQEIVEWWNGTKWSIRAAPISTSYDSSGLADVWCTSTTACTAVGSYHDPTTGDRALAEVAMLRWQLESVPVPAGEIAGSLDQVSCALPTACMAIGNFETASDFESLSESWNGTAWTIQPTPNASASNLSGVSCTAANACTAVGDALSGGQLVTLAERWDGTSWTVQSTPNPATAANSYLLSVSCTSNVACTAVGVYVDGSGNRFTLAESWDGTTWTLDSTPNPTGTTTDLALNGVSCTSATACMAVGSYSPSVSVMFAESLSGTTWTLQSIPDPPDGSDSTLTGVSCKGHSVSSCTAVGSYVVSSHVVGLSEQWDGTSWTAYATAIPPHAVSTNPHGVSCVAVGRCIAVGSYRRGSGITQTLAEHFGVTIWSLLVTPAAPGGSPTSVLSGVSCPSKSSCTAIGYYNDGSSNPTLLAEGYS